MHLIHALQQWLHQQSWLELVGLVTGLLCVYLAARNSIWNWPFAIINTAICVYVFAKAALYADMGQNAYLFCLNIYGWYYWSQRPPNEAKLPVVRISQKQILTAIIITLLATPAMGFLLVKLSAIGHYQPAAYPYLDSFCSVISLTAQVFMARKVLENWLMWIFVDIIYTGIYIAKGLEPFALMFGIYTIIALMGYLDWRKDYKKQGNHLSL